MAQIQYSLLLLISITFTISSTLAISTPIQALVAPITKHTSPSPFYTITFLHQNPNYLLDLSGPLLWSPCPDPHPTIPCNSTTCHVAHVSPPPRRYCPRRRLTKLPSTHPNSSCTCKVCGSSDLTLTHLALSSTDGHHPTAPVALPRLVSACSGPTAIAGLSRSATSLPTQLSSSSSLSIKSQFAICLPSATSRSPGVAFFGEKPFYLLPPNSLDVSASLSYTPLVKNPMDPRSYYVNLQGIAVGGTHVRFLSRVLEFDSLGHGGVQLSTAAPYTALRSHVYVPFLRAFAEATRGIRRVPRVRPFGLCLNSSGMGSTRVGYAVPRIDLMLPGGKNWTVFGANSLKQVADDVACLAFVDGGPRAEKAVVVGGFQMEDNFLLFDVGRSRLGFSSSLLFSRTTCGNFNFTTSGV